MIPGGVDPIELAQADHIALLVFDPEDPPEDPEKAKKAAPQDVELRVGEERMVKAAARSKSGNILASIPVTIAIHEDDDEAITLDEDGLLTAAGAGDAIVRAESMIAGIAGNLNVMVTKPIDKIVFAPDTDDYSLAAGESTGEITATAEDEDGNEITPRSGWSWESDDTGVATVAKVKVENDDGDMVVKGMGQHAMITGAGTGSTEIMATAEGVSGSISVSVTGQSITRVIDPSASNNGNSFVWDLGKDGGAGFTTPEVASGNATTVFDVNLRDVMSGDLITAWTLGVSPANPVAGTAATDSDAQVDPAVGAAAGTANDDGTVTVTITAEPVTTDIDEGVYETFVSLTATGAREARLRFTIEVVDTSE